MQGKNKERNKKLMERKGPELDECANPQTSGGHSEVTSGFWIDLKACFKIVYYSNYLFILYLYNFASVNKKNTFFVLLSCMLVK